MVFLRVLTIVLRYVVHDLCSLLLLPIIFGSTLVYGLLLLSITFDMILMSRLLLLPIVVGKSSLKMGIVLSWIRD